VQIADDCVREYLGGHVWSVEGFTYSFSVTIMYIKQTERQYAFDLSLSRPESTYTSPSNPIHPITS